MLCITLIVLKTDDLERLRAFYELLGMEFVRERHEKGPEHYSTRLGHDVVLELYPGDVTNTGLGLMLAEPVEVLHRLIAAGLDPHDRYIDDEHREVLVFYDPDGRRVELTRPT